MAMSNHSVPVGRCRGGVSGLALMMLVLAGCGDPGTSTSAGAGRDPGSPSAVSTTHSEEAAPEDDGHADDPAALGIDNAEWPEDLEGARSLFSRMPSRLAGDELRRPRFFGSAAGVVYGQGNSAPTAWVLEAGKDVPDARSALAVMFGMTLACKKDSYRGTAPESGYGGPDVDRSGDDEPGASTWWFACTVNRAEGDPGFTGYALGWTSGDLAWLTVSPDLATRRDLVEALLLAAK